MINSPPRFRADGTFRVLMMSDFQESFETCEKTLTAEEALVERIKPDLVVLGGDVTGPDIATPELLRRYLDLFVAPMEKRGIPWVHVFGNHDHDLPFDDAEKQAIYESYPHCLSSHVEGITGMTNFVLPVLGSRSDEPKIMLWGLDSNNKYSGDDGTFNMEHYKHGYVTSVWDFPRFDQVDWYYNTSIALEKKYGKKIPGTLFMHVAPQEAQFVVDNADKCGTTGSTVEHMTLSALNSGLFSAVKSRGDVTCIASGHSHKDTFDGTFLGVRMCLDGSAGYAPYGIDELRGGRVFDFAESDPAAPRTEMVYYADN